MSIPFNKLPWLNLSFKPDGDADITYDLTTSKKSKNMVKVMFRANPKPTSGIWWIGSTEIPTGEIVSYIEDPGFHFESSYFSDGDLEGEYQVTLEFDGMVEEENHNSILSVTNGLGTTNYTLFKDNDQSPTTEKPEQSSNFLTNLPKDVTEEEVTTIQNLPTKSPDFNSNSNQDFHVLPIQGKSSLLTSNVIILLGFIVVIAILLLAWLRPKLGRDDIALTECEKFPMIITTE